MKHVAVAFCICLLSCSPPREQPVDGGPGCLPLDDPDGGVAWTGLDAGDAGLPLAEFRQGMIRATCDGFRRCAGFDQSLVALCVSDLTDNQGWPLEIGGGTTVRVELQRNAQVDAALDAGTLIYDPRAAAECLASPWTACGQGLFFRSAIGPKACDRAVVPTIPPGKPCRSDVECTSFKCTLDTGTCPGTCAPPSPPGEPTVASSCAHDAGCGGSADLVCDGVLCHRNRDVGAACADDLECRPDLYCAHGASPSQPGACGERKGAGAACSFDDFPHVGTLDAESAGRSCQAGLTCRGMAQLADGGFTGGTCQAPSALGGDCTALGAGQVANVSGCLLGTVCSCGRCVRAPAAGKCAAAFTRCRPGVSFCDADGSCQPALPNDSACADGTQCAGGGCVCSDHRLHSCTDRICGNLAVPWCGSP